MSKTRQHCFDFGVPPALTLLLGLWGITRNNSMWRDEAATWEAAHRTIPEIWSLLGRIDMVHGLYYLFMHGVFTVFGDRLYCLRLPSLLAMACATALLTLLGSRLVDASTGLATGLAFALLPAVQQYAQEGRPYALVTACEVLACWLLVTAVDASNWCHWAAYGTTVLVAALLNWFSLLILFAHAATIALARTPRAVIARWALSASCAVLGSLPLVMASQAQSGQVSWIPPVGLGTTLNLLMTVVMGALGAYLARTRLASGSVRVSLSALALPLLALPPLLLLAVSLTRPLYQTRYVLFSQIGLALLIGAACHALASRFRRQPRRSIVLAAAVALVALLPIEVPLRSAGSRVDDVLSTADNVAAVRKPGDAVLYIPAARRDTALVSPGAFTGTRDLALIENPRQSNTLQGVEGTPEYIRKAMLTARRIIVVTDDNTSPPRVCSRPDQGASPSVPLHTSLRDP